MSDRIRHVLFLCTGNSARSVLAESALNAIGAGRFRGHSAGSHPTGQIHPMTLRCLEGRGHPTAELRSKGFDGFLGPDAPSRACPIWPGGPVSAHWGLPDPAAFEGSEAETWAVFEATYEALAHRVRLFTEIPFAELDEEALGRGLREVGAARPPGAELEGPGAEAQGAGRSS